MNSFISKKRNTTLYFYVVLVITCIWSFLLPNDISSFGVMFYMLSGFPVFFVLTQIRAFKFSSNLKELNPNLYLKKTSFNHIRNKRYFNLFTLWSSDYKEIDNVDLRDEYNLVKRTFLLVPVSFFMVIPIAIANIALKNWV